MEKKTKNNKEKFKKNKTTTNVCIQTEKKKSWCNQREKTNRMTMSEASVDDVIVLTDDVTARMFVCVNVHASPF